MRLSRFRASLAVVLSLAASAAAAQNYPNRPITLIVPFAAGGATDSIARILSEPLSQDLGQQVVIETVGAGQNDVAIRQHVDRTAVVVVPGMGDAVQMDKAGILEIADIMVVNKADLPQAERTARQFAALVPGVPVIRTVLAVMRLTTALPLAASVRLPVTRPATRALRPSKRCTSARRQSTRRGSSVS